MRMHSQEKSGDLPLRRLSLLITVGVAGLSLVVASAHARDTEQDLKDFMRLVVKSPSSFGFKDKSEAEKARLGRAYALYGVQEWKDYVKREKGRVTADPDQAPDKLYEVIDEHSKARCVFAYSRKADGSGYEPVSLGQPYVAPILQQMRGKAESSNVVLLLDLSTRTFHYAETRNPEVIRDFD